MNTEPKHLCRWEHPRSPMRGKPMHVMGAGFAIQCAQRKQVFSSKGLRCCSAGCERNLIYSPHGLRHLAGTALAESGATVDEIMSVLGHTTAKSARIYVEQANRKVMAKNAMEKWERGTG